MNTPNGGETLNLATAPKQLVTITMPSFNGKTIATVLVHAYKN